MNIDPAISVILTIGGAMLLFLAGLWWWFASSAKNKIWEPETEQVEFIPIIAANEAEDELDEQSGTWRFIKAWAVAELEDARKRNDKVSLSADQTAALRGEIKILKRLAKLPEIISSRDNRLKMSKPPEQAGGNEYGDE